MIWHTSSAKDVLNELKTDSQNGLSGAEVNSRLAKYGKNLPDKKRERTFKELFLSQLKDVPTVVLTVAAILYFIIALITPENSDISTSVAEPIIVLLIVVINAVTGALQQTGAEAAVESLKFISPPSATSRQKRKDGVCSRHQHCSRRCNSAFCRKLHSRRCKNHRGRRTSLRRKFAHRSFGRLGQIRRRA